jgi:MFS family permease
LLVASVTTEPAVVSLAVFLQRVPWLLLGVLAGAVVDRVDRRRLSILVNVFRAAVLAVLAAVVATGHVPLAVVLVALFLLGCAECLADTAGAALVATTVPRADLGLANSRLFGSMLLTNQLAGPPIGAALFGLGRALPFGTYAFCLLLAAVLLARMQRTAVQRPPSRPIRHEIAEGLRWLAGHAPMRTLALTITAFNLTFGAAFSVWVLYAQQRLGLGALGFGVLMAISSVGGLLGVAAYSRLETRFGLSWLMRVGLVIETLTHLALGLTTVAWVAGAVMLVFGVHAMVWGTTATTIRQQAVPEPLLGRVTSVYAIGSVGALSLGTLLGGVIAQRFGVAGPFWFAFVGSAVITALMWRSFRHLVPDDQPALSG